MTYKDSPRAERLEHVHTLKVSFSNTETLNKLSSFLQTQLFPFFLTAKSLRYLSWFK